MAKRPTHIPAWERAGLERLAAEQARTAAVALNRLENNSKKLIEAACAGTVRSDQLSRPANRELCAAIERSTADPMARASLRDLLLFAATETGFLFDSVSIGGRTFPFFNALIKLNDRRSSWIAQPRSWTVPSYNSRRQLSSFVRHLLTRYPVPLFMDEAWLNAGPGSRRYRDWFVHIGSGHNIRTAKTPIPMTKMMAHHFLEAPGDMPILGAIRWGQVHALGGDKRLTGALLGSRIGTVFANDEFWTSVIRFCVANPMLDRRHVAPVVDFLQNQKFETVEMMGADGTVTTLPPQQPNLSMRGRSATALLDAVERWHGELGRKRKLTGATFKRSSFAGLQLTSGDGKTIWQIRELLSEAELALEGRALRHCVVSYASSCERGDCSIWTLERRKESELDKLQTIEVRDKTIVQCRGKYNRPPTAQEFDVVGSWARKAGLGIGDYVDVER